jgi:hypothetical protein
MTEPIFITVCLVLGLFLVVSTVIAPRIVRHLRLRRQHESIADDAELRVLRSLGEEVSEEEFTRVLAHERRVSSSSWPPEQDDQPR